MKVPKRQIFQENMYHLFKTALQGLIFVIKYSIFQS